MQFTVQNTGPKRAEVELAGWLENAVCLHSGSTHSPLRVNHIMSRPGFRFLECRAEAAASVDTPKSPDITFEDFEREGYAPWTTTGTAFGSGPVTQAQVPEYQGDLNIHGRRAVNTHAAAPASEVGARDAARGTLPSPPFQIERRFINCLIGGGAHNGKTCVNVVVDGKVIASITGANANRMEPHSIDVRRWAGRTARIVIVDDESGGWGNIGVDNIVFSDQPAKPLGPLEQEGDFGTLGLALLDARKDDRATAELISGKPYEAVFNGPASTAEARKPFGEKLVGALGRKVSLRPGASANVTFVVAWHFPNLRMDKLPPGRAYAKRFGSALEVASYVSRNYRRLSHETRLWHDTWYDSTLPYWFLDRTFLNTSILATSTCFRFGDGRFYGWEGVGCCAGTCGHVWQYAQAVARLFPELERDTRERVDFGLALKPDGAIWFRGEFNNIPAVDAQAGTILRALREHQMCADAAWLKRNWPGIKKATEWLIAKDGDGDGLIASNQHNTLDTDWYGPVAWLSGLYLGALLAAAALADQAGDPGFAAKCRAIVERGQQQFLAGLFDGEYFINRPDPKHLDAINSGTGCHIDQVMGQGWAFQVGLPRVLPEKETVSALKSLWHYNFTPDVGPYRAAYKAGRWYAMPGEAGLLMCTFPRSDWDYTQAKGKGPEWAAGYFNECMNGFEYQVAGHMLWEGLVTEGLAITRAVHDRYHAARRNPFNEVECGDHYARSMASYGVFLAACGFECDGPRGHLGFAPRLTPDNFRAAFTVPEGWGSFSQKFEGSALTAELALKWGRLRLKTLSLQLPEGAAPPRRVRAKLGGSAAKTTCVCHDRRLEIEFNPPVVLTGSQTLQCSTMR
jgi:non-lysosomal glucosylceramidase